MKKKYRNTAFLVELLVNIFVFSISCAVLVGLFGKAAEMARHTKEDSMAGAEANYLVEHVKVYGHENFDLGHKTADNTYVCAYNQKGEFLEDENGAAFLIYISFQPEHTKAGTLQHIHVQAESETGRLLYELETACYSANNV